MGIDDDVQEHQAKLKVPTYARHLGERVSRDVSVLLAYEAINDEVIEDPTALARLQERQAASQLPPVYWEHPVVQEHGAEAVYPLAVYLDGIPFRKKNSVLAFVIINLITGTRFLAAVLRKSELCRCGCKGWCTLFTVWSYVRWNLEVLASKVFPTEPHAGLEWPEERFSWG